MAPQTPHLQAVAGWQWEAGGEDRKREERQAGAGNANRRPRAQPIIYAALCICVRTDRPPCVQTDSHMLQMYILVQQILTVCFGGGQERERFELCCPY